MASPKDEFTYMNKKVLDKVALNSFGVVVLLSSRKSRAVELSAIENIIVNTSLWLNIFLF